MAEPRELRNAESLHNSALDTIRQYLFKVTGLNFATWTIELTRGGIRIPTGPMNADHVVRKLHEDGITASVMPGEGVHDATLMIAWPERSKE